MLPVKKQDTEREDFIPSAASGFGKVLGSIQGLQQRLGDFSYGEVSIAEAKVKMLVKQLTLLRDNLDNLAELKFEIQEINRRVSQIPAASFDQVALDNLEKHPQLHAILQTSKLVSLPELMNVAQQGASAASAPKKNAHLGENELAAQLAEQTATTAHEPAVEAKQPSDSEPFTHGAGEATRASSRATVAKYRIVAKFREPAAPTAEPPTFTIPNEAIIASNEPRSGAQAKDWSFDASELTLSEAEASSAPINFEFPLESVDVPKPAGQVPAKTKPAPPEASPTATPITATPTKKFNAAEAKPPVTTPDIPPPKPAPKKPETQLDASKALVPAHHDFDQRLLDDVIRNYGDFATSANLPATLESTPKIVPVPLTGAPQKTAAPEFAGPTAAERKSLEVKKSGDLDRQLKKIIKDYGEYDIYQRKSPVSFKTGGIIAFAVLGIVLAMLYLFKPTAAVSTPQVAPMTQPPTVDRGEPSPSTKSSAGAEQRVGSDSANAGSNKLTESKPNP
jgi:hypothetical protein